VRYASIDQVAHDPYGDLLTASGGVLLAVLCIHLYRRMLIGRGDL
jgi:hypothetical protein